MAVTRVTLGQQTVGCCGRIRCHRLGLRIQSFSIGRCDGHHAPEVVQFVAGGRGRVLALFGQVTTLQLVHRPVVVLVVRGAIVRTLALGAAKQTRILVADPTLWRQRL